MGGGDNLRGRWVVELLEFFRRVERQFTLLVEVGFIFLSRRTGAEWSDSVVGEGVPDPRIGKKGEK